MHPGHPTFPFRRSTGITFGTSSYEHLIAVNQVGKRFYNEMDIAKRYERPVWPGGPRVGAPKHSLQHRPVRLAQLQSRPGSSRCTTVIRPWTPPLAMNEGSEAPHYYSGPLWAIFDSGTIERDGWNIKPPFTADNGYFFSADTIEELARKIYARHEFQRVPLKHLKETVRKWNTYVDEGTDPDFGRGKDAPMHKIDKPPFYAAAICPVWHDSYGGLRINGKSSGRRHGRRGHPRSLFRRRSQRRRQPAWPGPRPWSTATSPARNIAQAGAALRARKSRTCNHPVGFDPTGALHRLLN